MNDQELYCLTDDATFDVEAILKTHFTAEQHTNVRIALEIMYRVGNRDGYKEAVTEKGETA